MRISVITAFFNESANLPVFRERLVPVLEQVSRDWEVVLVDDHSSDEGSAWARHWAATDPRVRYLRLSRNSGSHAAFSAGLAHCSGDCAVLLAADLQDPPEAIPELVGKWHSDCDVVWAVRSAREAESRLTRWSASLYYRLMRRCALAEMPARGADFLLLDRKVIEAYGTISEKNTSLLAMILWMGFRQGSIEYVKRARHAGRSKWTLAKKLKLLADSVVSFSYAPIRAMSYAGLLMALAGFLYALAVVAGRLGGWITAGSGFAALMTVLLIGQGLILTMLGVLGEYLWRTFDEARGRPRYFIEEYRSAPNGARSARSDRFEGESDAPAPPPAQSLYQTSLEKQCTTMPRW